MVNGEVYAADSTGIMRYAQTAVIAMAAAYGQAHTQTGSLRNATLTSNPETIGDTPTVDYTELGSGILDTLVLYPGMFAFGCPFLFRS